MDGNEIILTIDAKKPLKTRNYGIANILTVSKLVCPLIIQHGIYKKAIKSVHDNNIRLDRTI